MAELTRRVRDGLLMRRPRRGPCPLPQAAAACCMSETHRAGAAGGEPSRCISEAQTYPRQWQGADPPRQVPSAGGASATREAAREAQSLLRRRDVAAVDQLMGDNEPPLNYRHKRRVRPVKVFH